MSPTPRADNPFAASRLRPGAIEYLSLEGDATTECLARLESNGWWGQIRGPHGSGKSTLLAALVPRVQAAGRTVHQYTLRDGQRCLSISREQANSWTERTQLIIDGYEQLSCWSRWRVRRLCRRIGCGLLITTHRDAGFSEVHATGATKELARRVAARLMDGWPPLIQSRDVNRCFAEHGGDLRETLFALYDLYERRRD